MNGCSCGRAREAFEVAGAASRRACGGPRSARAPARTAASRRGISGKGQGTSATCRGSSSAAKWAGSDVPAARSAGVSLSRAPLDPNHARKPANRSSDRSDLHQTRFLHAHGSAHMARQGGGGGRRAGGSGTSDAGAGSRSRTGSCAASRAIAAGPAGRTSAARARALPAPLDRGRQGQAQGRSPDRPVRLPRRQRRDCRDPVPARLKPSSCWCRRRDCSGGWSAWDWVSRLSRR
jgi:hypothetical protein